MQNEYLAHFGVKGMKWGVWNDETRRKRMGGGNASSPKKLSTRKKVAMVAGGTLVTFGASVVANKITGKIINKRMRAAGKKAVEDIDWDSIGPEIIKNLR